MKHLKLFETEAQYESFKSGSDYVLPNVSYVESEGVYYEPYKEEIIEASFEIEMHQSEVLDLVDGQLNGDFTNIYEQLCKFIVDNATTKYENGGYYVNSDVTLAKTKIFVNGDRVDELDFYSPSEAIDMFTNGKDGIAMAHAMLEPNAIYYEHSV